MSDKPKTLKALAPLPANEVAPVSLPVVTAIKAMHEGTATPHQQQLALQWIVREAAGKAHFPYHATERDTVFALGRLFVAEQIVGLFNADLSSLRRQDDAEIPSTRTAPAR